MPTTCEIEFENNPLKVVYSGQVLRGNVKLTLTNMTKVRCVYIKFCGEGYCHWTTGSGAIRLTPGTHNYTFECMLPHLLPTSFEGEYGHIRYSACVVLDILIWPQKEFSVPFTVIKPVDLNADRTLRAPAVADIRKTFYPYHSLLCCCKSDPLDVYVHTPVGGYTPGQTINLYITVNNKSTQPVFDFIVQLVKEIRYTDSVYNKNSKLQTEILTGKTASGCELNNKTTSRVNIVVPSIPPTQKKSTNIIQIEYSIRVIGRVFGPKTDLTIKLPIVIGTIPIADNNQSFGQMPTSNTISPQPTAPIFDETEDSESVPDSNEQSSSVLPYPNEDPPTYEEAIQSNNIEGAFKPKYAVYRRQTSYSNLS